jgi:two-component system sensor histidine kinase SenX3
VVTTALVIVCVAAVLSVGGCGILLVRLRRERGQLVGRLEGAAQSARAENEANRRRVDAVRRDFVSNISHELQTPVGALALLAETLVAETGGDEPEAPLDATEAAVVHRLATRVLHEALRIGRTIEDLLELARLEADVEPRRVRVKLRHLLADAAARARPGAALRSVELTVDAGPGTVLVDERQIVSALSNLVDNAVKYSPQGATVELSASVDDGGWAEVSVRDHGIGIPEADRDRVFERFYRVDQARSRETGGTGLGLAIVRHVAANHGGEVRVASIEGEGSTFVLRLPEAASDPDDARRSHA